MSRASSVPVRIVVLSMLVACTETPSASPTTRVVEAASFPATLVDELDLVLQIDNSGSTVHLQVALGEALGPLLAALDGVSLHVGVASSDYGTAGGPNVGTVGQGGCAGYGDAGVFKTSGASVTGSFLSTDPVNFDGSLRSNLEVMLRLGSTGCGFEQPLAATRAALRANEGFRRPDASLAIIIVADEDDCSIQDPALVGNDPALGPLTSFRCTSQGVVCDQSLDTPGEKTNCRPNTASPYLEDPDLTRRELEALVRPERLTVSAIVGAPSPFAIETRSINAMTQLGLAHSCMFLAGGNTAVADPPIRIASLVTSFASRGNLESTCDLDYVPEVTRIAATIKRSLGIACIDASRLSDTLDTPGIQPACEVHETDEVTRSLARCPSADDCFDVIVDPVACPELDHLRVLIDRKTPPSADAIVDVSCEAPVR